MFKSFKQTSNKKAMIPVGVYASEVKAVEFHPDYADESAILITYELTGPGESQKVQSYKETFFLNDANKRTKVFFEYLDANGITPETLKSFEGCSEELTIKKNVRGAVTFPTITERRFVSQGDEDVAI